MILLKENKVFREISVFQRSQKDQEKTMIKPFKNGTRTMKNQDKNIMIFPTPLFRILVSIWEAPGLQNGSQNPPHSFSVPGVLDQPDVNEHVWISNLI